MSVAYKFNNHPFLESQVILSLANGVVETLKTMADVDAEFEKPFAVMNWQSPADVSVHLSLNTNGFKGRLLFHFTNNVAKEIIERMTGENVGDGMEQIFDGVGEVSNIFYGAAKAKLNAVGFNLTMTIPKACYSSQLPKFTQDTTCMLIPFKVLGETCYVEIILFN